MPSSCEVPEASQTMPTVREAHLEHDCSFLALGTCAQSQPEYRMLTWQRATSRPSTNHICSGSIALSLPGISLGSEWCFQIPFPALTAVNSEPQGLPTEQFSRSSIHPHSYGTAAP